MNDFFKLDNRSSTSKGKLEERFQDRSSLQRSRLMLHPKSSILSLFGSLDRRSSRFQKLQGDNIRHTPDKSELLNRGLPMEERYTNQNLEGGR